MSDTSAAQMIATSQPVKIENISIPGFGPQNQNDFNVDKYRVRHVKIDCDDPGALAELDILETKGLKGEEIVILNKTGWSFLDKYLMIVTYLELVEQSRPMTRVG